MEIKKLYWILVQLSVLKSEFFSTVMHNFKKFNKFSILGMAYLLWDKIEYFLFNWDTPLIVLFVYGSCFSLTLPYMVSFHIHRLNINHMIRAKLSDCVSNVLQQVPVSWHLELFVMSHFCGYDTQLFIFHRTNVNWYENRIYCAVGNEHCKSFQITVLENKTTSWLCISVIHTESFV